MATLTINKTRLVDRTLTSEKKVIAHEGSSGSSKTMSLAQVHLIWSFQEQQKLYSIVRATMPALKKGAIRDWKRVLRQAGAVGNFDVNKTDHLWTNKQTGTQVEFFALDNEQKGRGPRRDRLWVNEANELTHDTYRQLAKRTRKTICLDYNPSMQRHWIYSHVLTREDCEYIHSTYEDNSFLTEEEIREIEVEVPVYQEDDGTLITDWDLSYDGDGRLISGDPYHWAVFGLGQRGAPTEAIYPLVYEAPFPEEADSVLGLDFGWNHPMVLLRVARKDPMGRNAELYFDELVNTSFITTDDLIEQLPDLGVGKDELIWADSARPGEIEKIRRAGYNIKPAWKGPGSVYTGITWVKKHTLYFTARSARSKAQYQDYRWKKRADGTVLDEPVKLNDDAPDAGRYGAHSHWGVPRQEVELWDF